MASSRPCVGPTRACRFSFRAIPSMGVSGDATTPASQATKSTFWRSRSPRARAIWRNRADAPVAGDVNVLLGELPGDVYREAAVHPGQDGGRFQARQTHVMGRVQPVHAVAVLTPVTFAVAVQPLGAFAGALSSIPHRSAGNRRHGGRSDIFPALRPTSLAIFPNPP